jgi:hypothetical protein
MFPECWLLAGTDVEVLDASGLPFDTSIGYFRVHPKGVGVVCVNPNGLEPETFITEYYGELYPPWRWFEKQDAIKKCNPGMALPDFYNICFERPRDDPEVRAT